MGSKRRAGKMYRAALIVSALLAAASLSACADKAPGQQTAQEDEAAPAVRGTDVETARAGCTLAEMRGTFEEPSPEEILDRLNGIRLEACREGLRNPATGDPLTEKDYVPLRWAADLERIAMTRAAEATVTKDHVRPWGGSCFDVAYPGLQANYETLAWGYGSILGAVEGWYSEKSAYAGGEEGVFSHYAAMIAPANLYVGAADFTPSSGGGEGDACAAEFAMDPGAGAPGQEPQVPESALCGGYGECVQMIEIPVSDEPGDG